MKFPLNCVCPSPNHIEKTASQKGEAEMLQEIPSDAQLLLSVVPPVPKAAIRLSGVDLAG
jgi:hypothetical protein